MASKPEDVTERLEKLTSFLSDHESYSRRHFMDDWSGSNDELYADLLDFIDNDFDESVFRSPEEYRENACAYS